MTPCFHPRLVNGPFLDPVLYIDFLYQNRAILFDIGDITNLSSRHIHKVTDVFVSHTHMDHFIGLDHIIRLFLGRDKGLNIYGPPKIIDNVNGKLSAYTWNLVDNYENRFEVKVIEVHKDHLKKALFRCHNTFQREILQDEISFNGRLLDEEEFCIHSASLDHFTPCLAFCLEEKSHINIKKDRLDELGLPAGPWLKELKGAIRQGKQDDYHITIYERNINEPYGQKTTLGWIREAGLFTISRGQKIAYVVDIDYSPQNVQKLIPLVREADYLFCEAAFLEEDREIAQRKYHLTARQAGLIAKNGNVRKLIPFHFSPRYHDRGQMLYQEAQEAFSMP